jgi:hypothetical protein
MKAPRFLANGVAIRSSFRVESITTALLTGTSSAFEMPRVEIVRCQRVSLRAMRSFRVSACPTGAADRIDLLCYRFKMLRINATWRAAEMIED